MKPLHLARWIITESKQSLSNLEIQMVLWFLELKHRVEYGKPLLDGDFVIKGDETLSLGIVNMEIYREYRCFGANSIYIDNPMSFKEKMGEYEEKKVGWIGWIDKNIRNLSMLKYFTLKAVMFRYDGLVYRKKKEKNFSRIKSFEIEREAEYIFGKRGVLRIEKPKIEMSSEKTISTTHTYKPNENLCKTDKKIGILERVLWVVFFAWIFWSILNLDNNSIVIAFLDGIGSIK